MGSVTIDGLVAAIQEGLAAGLADQMIGFAVGEDLDLPGFDRAVVRSWDPETGTLTVDLAVRAPIGDQPVAVVRFEDLVNVITTTAREKWEESES